VRELKLCQGRNPGYELYRGFSEVLGRQFGEEDATMVGAAKVALKRNRPV
jgi:hypothetical protein